MPVSRPAPERFFEKVAWSERIFTDASGNTSLCLEWQACLNPAGYGMFRDDFRKTRLAHRWYYEFVLGDLPAEDEEGTRLVLDHLCRNRRCVNPLHLEVVTDQTNAQRGFSPSIVAQRSGVCAKGLHVVAGDNVFRKNGSNKCLACTINTRHAYKARLRAQIAAGTYAGKHGSKGYDLGCRCVDCMDAYHNANARRRQRRQALRAG